MPRYTDNFRADAVLMLEAAGYPDTKGALTAVSKRVKVPLATLHRWFHKKQNAPPSELVNEKRINLVEEIEKLIGVTLIHANDAVQDASYRDLMTGLGILVDKKQLLSDKPTERIATEQKIINVDSDEREAAVREAERIIGRISGSPPDSVSA